MSRLLPAISRIAQRSFRNHHNFGAAFGVDVVMNATGAVGFGHGNVHLLRGFFGGANEDTGFQRDVSDDAFGAGGSAIGAQFVELEVFRCGVLGFGVLLQGGIGENYRAGFGVGIG